MLPILINEILDFSKPTDGFALFLIQKAKPLIDNILVQMAQGTFDFGSYSFDKQPQSGLTKQAGLYLIVNKGKNKVYLGGTSNLAQRKGDYKRNFTTRPVLKKNFIQKYEKTFLRKIVS